MEIIMPNDWTKNKRKISSNGFTFYVDQPSETQVTSSEMTPEEFLRFNKENNQRITQLKNDLGYNEGEGVSGQPLQLSKGIEAGKELINSRLAQPIVAPIRTLLRGGDILQTGENIANAAVQTVAAPIEYLNMALKPITNAVNQTPVAKAINESPVGQIGNELLTRPASMISRGATALENKLGIQENPSPRMKEFTQTAENVGNLVMQLLLGKGIDTALPKGLKAPEINKPLTQISENRLAELKNENKNKETGTVSPEQSQPVIRPTEEQAQGRTTRQRSSNIQEEKSQQTPKTSNINPILQDVKFTPKQVMSGDMPTPQAVGYAKKILGENFDPELSKYMRQPENISRLKEMKDPTRERAAIMEDFSRRTIAADMMGEKDINADIIGNANKFNMKAQNVTQEKAQGGQEKITSQRVMSLKPLKGEGKTKTRGLSKRFANDISSDISKFDLPEYNVKKNDPQIQKVSDIAASDPEKLVRMYLGQEKTPSDILPGFIYSGVKQLAKEGKIPAEMLPQLANSDFIAKQGTTAGQVVQSFINKDPLDPINAVKEIKMSREEKFLQDTGRKDIEPVKARIREQIKTEVSKNNLQYKDWNDFINSLVCK